jgi:hypothetical protein
MANEAAEADLPRESRGDLPISPRVLKRIEETIHNLEHGLVGGAFELDELQDLLDP